MLFCYNYPGFTVNDDNNSSHSDYLHLYSTPQLTENLHLCPLELRLLTEVRQYNQNIHVRTFQRKYSNHFQVGDYLTMSEQVHLPKACSVILKTLKNKLIRITMWYFSQDRFKKQLNICETDTSKILQTPFLPSLIFVNQQNMVLILIIYDN